MEIQADLIRLDESGRLPLPWLVRAHLGLETNTGVAVFLTEPKQDDPSTTVRGRAAKREPGQHRISDILVTPLTVNKINSTFSVDIYIPEGKGAIQQVLSAFGPDTGANIVVSETITLEGRAQHKISLVIEPADDHSMSAAKLERVIDRQLKALKKSLNRGRKEIFKASDVRKTFESELGLMPQAPLRIDNAFLPTFDWREVIQSQHGVEAYDLDHVVVSSNPMQRVLRFVFPKRGAFQLEVPHHNIPGALDAITEKIRDKDFNILSSRLSRTPRPPMTERMSVFVAVCEPEHRSATNTTEQDRRAAEDLCTAIRGIESKYITNKAVPKYGQLAAKTRYTAPRNSRYIYPPEYFLSQIQAERSKAIDAFRAAMTDNRAPANPYKPLATPKIIFVSNRYIKDRRPKSDDWGDDTQKQSDEKFEATVELHKQSMRTIVKAIKDSGCIPFVPPPPGRTEMTAHAIYPLLWGADACLILAMNEHATSALSASQAHEYGFFMGQGKPARILVRRHGLPDTNDLGNLDGFIRLTYDGGKVKELRDQVGESSLYQRVCVFLKSLKAKSDSLIDDQGYDDPESLIAAAGPTAGDDEVAENISPAKGASQPAGSNGRRAKAKKVKALVTKRQSARKASPKRRPSTAKRARPKPKTAKRAAKKKRTRR